MLLEDFVTRFDELIDPRVDNANKRHSFMDILVMAFLGIFCGCDDWADVALFARCKQDLLEDFLELPHGIPSPDTFERVFSMIDPIEFERIFADWMGDVFTKTRGEIIAIDGKTLRGARESNSLKGAHLVQAFALSNQLTLGVKKVDAKTNEITVIPKLLRMLRIADCTVTLDAMGCQTEIAQAIRNKKAHYVLCVKGNQKDLLESIDDTFKLSFEKSLLERYDSGEQYEKGHGREECRRYQCLPVSRCPHLKEHWPGIQSIVRVQRSRSLKNKQTEQTQYYISSHVYHSPTIEKAIRNHWAIENQLHHVMDVTYREDHNRSRIKHQAQNIAMLRRLTLAQHKQAPEKGSIKGKRKQAAWDNQYLCGLLNVIFSKNIKCEQLRTKLVDS